MRRCRRDRAARGRARRCARRTTAPSRRSSGSSCCPGPLGPRALSARAARGAHLGAARRSPSERDFGWFAARAFHVIDWIPQRVTRIHVRGRRQLRGRAVSAGARRPRNGCGPRRASCSRAARARSACAWASRCRAAARSSTARRSAPGEPAREESLASLEGLLWRALVAVAHRFPAGGRAAGRLRAARALRLAPGFRYTRPNPNPAHREPRLEETPHVLP